MATENFHHIKLRRTPHGNYPNGETDSKYDKHKCKRF